MVDRSALLILGKATAAVSELAITVVAGAFLGRWLDSQAGSSPTLLLLLTIGATLFGFIRLVRSVQKLHPDDPLPPTHRDHEPGAPGAGHSRSRDGERS